MVSSYNHYRAAGNAPDGAAMAAIRFNRLPLTLASVTTALGFLGLTFSPSPPVRVVGYTVAAGIVLSYILCVTLLPALLARVDPHTPGRHAPTFRLRSVAGFVGQRSRAIVLVFVAAAVPAGYWVGKNVISDNVFEYFPRSHDFYRATALVDRHMSGINEVLYAFDSGERGGLFDVAVIDKLDAFRAWLLEQDEVLRVASLSTLPQIAEARSDGRLTERLAHYRETALRREATPAVFRSGLATTRRPSLRSAAPARRSCSHISASVISPACSQRSASRSPPRRSSRDWSCDRPTPRGSGWCVTSSRCWRCIHSGRW